MKFFNGHWEKQYGVSVYLAAQVYEWHQQGEELIFLAPHQRIRGSDLLSAGWSVETLFLR